MLLQLRSFEKPTLLPLRPRRRSAFMRVSVSGIAIALVRSSAAFSSALARLFCSHLFATLSTATRARRGHLGADTTPRTGT
eukprot:9192009-Pyramimonas_sp.AAC.1